MNNCGILIKRTSFSLFASVLFLAGYGQYSETIRSDRPGQANTPFTVGARVFQIQAGGDVGGSQLDVVPETSGSNYLANSMFRYGFTEQFEVSATVGYLNDEHNISDSSFTSSGINTLAIALRSNVVESEGLVPSFGYMVEIGTPWVSEDFKADQIAPKIMVMTSQVLGGNWGFATNLGSTWNGMDAKPEGFYVLNLSLGVNDKIGVFGEHYASFSQGDWYGKYDAGLSFLANNDLQFDILGGYSNDGMDLSEWFVSAGLSWRMRGEKKNIN